MATEKVPVTDGLPEITPAVERLRPVGSPVADQLRLALDPDPPVAVRVSGP